MMAGIILLVGCKPTEQNYRAAYEAAQAKTDTGLRDIQGAERVLQDDGITFQRVHEGDTVLQGRRSLKIEGLERATTPYIVGIGVFKMPANAHSRAADLSSQGIKSYVGEDGEDRYVVATHPCATFGEAVVALKTFRRLHRDFPYVGLPGQPVIYQVR